jgi:Predicted transcriptional regulators
MQSTLMILRKTKGLSQKGLAEVLGISEESYRNKELGKTQFKMNEMFELATIFDEDVGKIFLPTKFTKSEQSKSVS